MPTEQELGLAKTRTYFLDVIVSLCYWHSVIAHDLGAQ